MKPARQKRRSKGNDSAQEKHQGKHQGKHPGKDKGKAQAEPQTQSPGMLGISRRRTRLIAGLTGAAALIALAWVLWPVNPDRAQIALGARVYAKNCASCHGVNLEGQPNWRKRGPDGKLPAPPHTEKGHTWHHPDSVLLQVIKYGTKAVAPPGYKTNMIGFGDRLSDQEIRAVLIYIKSKWPEDIRRRQAAVSRNAK